MRAAAYAVGVACLGLLLAATPAPGKGADETWYAQRLTSGDAPLRVDNLWSKGSRLRAETVIAGRPILTLVSGERYVIVDRLARRGVSIRRNRASVSADVEAGRLAGVEATPRVEIGDGTCHINPGITASRVRGISIIESDHPVIYEEIIHAATMAD